MGYFILLARPSVNNELARVMNKFKKEGDSKTDTLMRILSQAEASHEKKHLYESVSEELGETYALLYEKIEPPANEAEQQEQEEVNEKPSHITFIKPGETKEEVRKNLIRRYSNSFGGLLTDSNMMKIIGVDALTYYKLKNEVKNGR